VSRPVFIAALSGRALAHAVRRGGQRCVVFDLFADDDTQALADRCQRLPRGPEGFDRAALLEAVAHEAEGASGFVYGAGLEHDPALLAAIARRVPLLGNDAETVAAVKDPLRFAALLARLGLPHPPTRQQAPRRGAWLIKREGGSGGTHITPLTNARVTPSHYAQRRLEGDAVSALFVADGRRARVIGHTRQWCSATADAPFRYGGAAGPLPVASDLAAAIAAACDAIAAATGLVGLNSLDLLVAGGEFHVLEVNPRPGATLDVFATLPLWRWHCAGVAGRLADATPATGAMHGAEIFYAPARLVIPAGFAWPSWTADRSPARSVIEAEAPVCTVIAVGPGLDELRATLARRATLLLRRLGAAAVAA
jgi:hypothetical protein